MLNNVAGFMAIAAVVYGYLFGISGLWFIPAHIMWLLGF